MAARNAKRRKLKTLDDDDERSLKLHTTNCDKMYRWSMWRMYLNEELSSAITSQRDFNDHSHSISRITSHYIEHPDGSKYGRLMRNRSRTYSQYGQNSDKILADNVYLVYGIPRISLAKRAPSAVTELHSSMQDLMTTRMPIYKSDIDDTDKQISEMFNFVSIDITKSESQLSLRRLGVANTSVVNGHEHSATDIEQDTDVEQKVDSISTSSLALSNFESLNGVDVTNRHATTKSGTKYPLVSRSRLFWEKLANKRSEIVDLNKAPPTETGHVIISSDILQKQQKLLKKTVRRQRTSKDLWKTLAERKTEILQMRELGDQTNTEKKEDHAKSKTSQLWGFIFSKKKDLLQMKRGNKINSDQLTKDQANIKQTDHDVSAQPIEKTSVSMPSYSENTFQQELAERLRKRREKLSPSESTLGD